MVQVAVSFTEFRNLSSFKTKEDLIGEIKNKGLWCTWFELSEIRLGNEFCERLIPTSKQLQKTATIANQFGLKSTLTLANLTDQGQKKLRRLMPTLPVETDIVVNDWGTAHLIAEEFPKHTSVAGRLLCKHLKESRISKPAIDPEVNWPVTSEPFQNILNEFDIKKAEVDLAPHTAMPKEKLKEVILALHLNQGYSAKSHICKVGSTNQPIDGKFVSGHLCRRECLLYETQVSDLPHPRENELDIFQRGNTWFYKYTDRMNASVSQALHDGIVDDVVVTMD